MKINKLFHWLYFFVMALPIVVAPIFAVYSHRHDISSESSYTVTTPIYYETNEVNTVDDLIVGNIYHFSASISDYSYNGRVFCSDYWIYSNLPVTTTTTSPYSKPYFYFYDYGFGLVFDDNGQDSFYLWVDSLSLDFVYRSDADEILLPMINFISNDISEMRVKNYESITYSFDKDIIGAFVSSYANAIDKYFNYDGAFNFGTLYTWLNTTFFNSQAPLGFFIFWHLLIYWLLTSILWLVFDVLMYVPQLVHRWLDKASIS